MSEATKLKSRTKKSDRKTVRIVIDEYLQSVIDSRKSKNAMLADADIVKILLGEKVTEEMRIEQQQAGRDLLELVGQVKTPQSFQNLSADEQEAFIESRFN